MRGTIPQHGTRRQRRDLALRSRRRALVTSTFATGLAVMLGLSGAGGTYAWLSASVSAPGATVSSGTLTLLINDSTSAALGTWSVAPAKPIAKAFAVKNTGDASSSLTVQITATTTPSLMSYATARVTPVQNSASCAPGLTGTQGALNGYVTPSAFSTAAAGTTRWLCLEVGLAANTPVSASGQSLNFALNVTGEQNAG